VVPAVAALEVRRELERLEKTKGLARLEAFSTAEPDRYLVLSDAALRLAATLWARARHQGKPTADPRELDCDVIIAAQALTMGAPASSLIIATTNIGHLAQFVTAESWANIVP
jgi:predicted nucleic acid-binding protein